MDRQRVIGMSFLVIVGMELFWMLTGGVASWLESFSADFMPPIFSFEWFTMRVPIYAQASTLAFYMGQLFEHWRHHPQSRGEKIQPAMRVILAISGVELLVLACVILLMVLLSDLTWPTFIFMGAVIVFTGGAAICNLILAIRGRQF